MAAARTRSRFDREPDSRPQNDAYVGLLALSLLAMIASSILLWIDYSQYGSAKPPAPSIPAPPGPRESAPQSAPVGALPPGDNSLPVAGAPLPAPRRVPTPFRDASQKRPGNASAKRRETWRGTDAPDLARARPRPRGRPARTGTSDFRRRRSPRRCAAGPPLPLPQRRP